MHGATTIPGAEFEGKRMSEGTCRRRFGQVKTLLQSERQVASSPTSGSIKPDSGFLRLDPLFFIYCLRASAAAGSSQNSRRATLTAAPGYARRWCTIETHHLQRKHLVTPRREQPRLIMRGCDSPTHSISYPPLLSQKRDEGPSDYQ